MNTWRLIYIFSKSNRRMLETEDWNKKVHLAWMKVPIIQHRMYLKAIIKVEWALNHQRKIIILNEIVKRT